VIVPKKRNLLLVRGRRAMPRKDALNARTIKGAADDWDDPVHTGPRRPAEEQERYRDEGRSKHSDEDAVFGRLLAAGLESRDEVVLQPPGVDAEAEDHADCETEESLSGRSVRH
jgi:hypothetical protein